MNRVSSQVKSKRRAYRFQCKGHPVSYKTASEDGTALMKDFSTAGCALCSATVDVTVQEKVLVIIDLEGVAEKVEAQGKVVRCFDNGFALEFTIFEQPTRDMMRTYFARILRK